MSDKFLRRLLRKLSDQKEGEQMTDQPNPVELEKEISGHPTDHSRKAGLDADFSDLTREQLEAAVILRTFERDTAEAEVKRIRGIVATSMSPVSDEGNSWEGPGAYPGNPMQRLLEADMAYRSELLGPDAKPPQKLWDKAEPHEIYAVLVSDGGERYKPSLDCSCGYSTGRCENWGEAGELFDEHVANISREAGASTLGER